MASRAPFDDIELRSELHHRFAEAGVRSGYAAENYPNIPLKALTQDGTLARFIDALNWAVGQMKSSPNLETSTDPT